MTIDTATAKVTANGNGTATVFSFDPVIIYESGDLVVTKVETDGTETLLVEGTGATNYSVSVSSFPGTGSITYPATGSTRLESGEKIVMKRVLDLEQLTDLQNQGPYLPETLETQLDKLVCIDIQQQEELDRSIKASAGEQTLNDLELPNSDTASGTDIVGIKSDKSGLEWRSGAGTLPDPVTVARGGTGAQNISDALDNLGAGATGKAIFRDTTAADARTELGLKSAAVEDVGADPNDVVQFGNDGSGNARYPAADGSQITKIANALATQLGQCRLNYSSATELKLERYNGEWLFINGAAREIPSAGVTIDNSGLSADTNYFVYAFMSGGAVTLELSTTTHAVDSTFGHRIKNADATRTLVGRVRTNGSSQFEHTPTGYGTAQGVWSYFNRRKYVRYDHEFWKTNTAAGDAMADSGGAFARATNAVSDNYWNQIPWSMMAKVEDARFVAIWTTSNTGNQIRLEHADNGPTNLTTIATLTGDGGGSPVVTTADVTADLQALQKDQSVFKHLGWQYAKVNATTFQLWGVRLEILWEISDDGNF